MSDKWSGAHCVKFSSKSTIAWTKNPAGKIAVSESDKWLFQLRALYVTQTRADLGCYRRVPWPPAWLGSSSTISDHDNPAALRTLALEVAYGKACRNTPRDEWGYILSVLLWSWDAIGRNEEPWRGWCEGRQLFVIESMNFWRIVGSTVHENVRQASEWRYCNQFTEGMRSSIPNRLWTLWTRGHAHVVISTKHLKKRCVTNKSSAAWGSVTVDRFSLVKTVAAIE